jgi:hypothetical protein
MPWMTDANGLSRHSKYVDRAPKPFVYNQAAFGYYGRHLDLRGQLAFVLKKKGGSDGFECSAGLQFQKGDTVSALVGWSGIQIGLSRTWSEAQTFASKACESCVAIIRLTDAKLVEDHYFNRKKQLKGRLTTRNVIREPGCRAIVGQDCEPKPDCPGCPQDPFMTSTVYKIAGQRAIDGDQRTVSLAVESFESTHETSGGLLADCYDWMNASFAAEETDATSGVFVDVPWQRLTYLPPDRARGGFLPAAMISAGLEVEPFGGIVLPRDEGFPLVFLVPRTNSVRLNSVFVTTREDSRRVGYLQSVVATLNSAPISILSTILEPMDGAAFSGGRLEIRLSDQLTDRSTLIQVPLATLATN